MKRITAHDSTRLLGARPTATMDGRAVQAMIRSMDSEQMSLLLCSPMRRRSRLTLGFGPTDCDPAFVVEAVVRHCEEGGCGQAFYIAALQVVAIQTVATAAIRRRLFSEPSPDVSLSSDGAITVGDVRAAMADA